MENLDNTPTNQTRPTSQTEHSTDPSNNASRYSTNSTPLAQTPEAAAAASASSEEYLISSSFSSSLPAPPSPALLLSTNRNTLDTTKGTIATPTTKPSNGRKGVVRLCNGEGGGYWRAKEGHQNLVIPVATAVQVYRDRYIDGLMDGWT